MRDGKAERRKKRLADRATQKKRLIAKQLLRDRFPEFIFDEREGDPEFVEVVKAAIKQFRFTDLPGPDQKAFRLMKRHGAPEALLQLRLAMQAVREVEPDNWYGQLGDIYWTLNLGEAVFRGIAAKVLERFLPVNDVQFILAGHTILVRFRSLLTFRSETGTTHYSRHKPSVEVDGARYTVGFSREAILRICQRVVPEWRSYAGLGNAYAYFEDCVHFETCRLKNGNLAITFFDECAERFWTFRYVDKLLGNDFDPSKGKPYFRVGYAPIVIEGEFAKAKTVLFPGFSATPECQALDQSALPREAKARLKRIATDERAASYLIDTDDFSAIEWFHRHAVPQVIQTDRVMFRRAIPESAVDYWGEVAGADDRSN